LRPVSSQNELAPLRKSLHSGDNDCTPILFLLIIPFAKTGIWMKYFASYNLSTVQVTYYADNQEARRNMIWLFIGFENEVMETAEPFNLQRYRIGGFEIVQRGAQ
jgi:hypothetical protein